MRRHAGPLVVFCLALGLVAFGSAPALAREPGVAPTADEVDEAPFFFGNETEAYLSPGITGGASFGSPGGGGYVGGEMSLAWLFEAWWGGLYVDGLYDFGHEAGMFSFGPELGYAFVGIDGGVALRAGEPSADGAEVGGTGRLLLTFGAFALYGRYANFPASDAAEHVGQVGALFKFPIWTSAEPRPLAP